MNWSKVAWNMKQEAFKLKRAPNSYDANKGAANVLLGIARSLEAGLTTEDDDNQPKHEQEPDPESKEETNLAFEDKSIAHMSRVELIDTIEVLARMNRQDHFNSRNF